MTTSELIATHCDIVKIARDDPGHFIYNSDPETWLSVIADANTKFHNDEISEYEFYGSEALYKCVLNVFRAYLSFRTTKMHSINLTLKCNLINFTRIYLTKLSCHYPEIHKKLDVLFQDCVKFVLNICDKFKNQDPGNLKLAIDSLWTVYKEKFDEIQKMF